jgi:hypothetical protein
MIDKKNQIKQIVIRRTITKSEGKTNWRATLKI